MQFLITHRSSKKNSNPSIFLKKTTHLYMSVFFLKADKKSNTSVIPLLDFFIHILCNSVVLKMWFIGQC